MFQRKASILFAIIAIGTILGFIIGVAPGYFLTSYALFGIGAGFLLLIFLFLIITTLIFEYLNKDRTASTPSIYTKIFHQSLSRNEKFLLSSTNCVLFTAGILLGILCELLLKAISAPLAAQLIIATIFISILLITLFIILVVEYQRSKKSKIDYYEPEPVIVESNPRSQVLNIPQDEPKNTASQVLTKPQDGPKNTASRMNRYRWRPIDDDSKSIWHSSSFNNSTNTFEISKPSSTIQTEYQKLLHPSPRFYINDKVYANDDDLAQVIETDGLGNYRIQYLDNGLIDLKNGSALRKALPFIN